MFRVLTRSVRLLTPKRRWAQFSLGSLFLVVTAFCVVLGLWIVPGERQRRAVAAIEAVNGWVKYAEAGEQATESLPEEFLRRHLPRDYFDEVHEVGLMSTSVTDASLADLRAMKGLRTIYLNAAQTTAAGLAHLHGLTSLRRLYLFDTRVTDTVQLRELTRLQELDLVGNQVTDAALANLNRLTHLRKLYLGGTQVTAAGVAKLREALPNCEIHGP